MIAPPASYTSAWIASGPGALPHQVFFYGFRTSPSVGSLSRSFLISTYGLFIDLSRAAENLTNVQPSVQDLLLLSQQLIPICSEAGGRGRGLWSINGFQSIIEAYGVITEG